MRKRFLFILSFLIAIIFVAVGGVCLFSWQKEKAKQGAFAVPTPSKDINWIVNENVIDKEALFIEDYQTKAGLKLVPLKGTVYVFTKVIKNEKMWLESDGKVFSHFDYGWFEKNNWIGIAGTGINNRYKISTTDALGVQGYKTGHFKIWGDSIKVILLRKQTEDSAFVNFPLGELNYPFHVQYKIFISDIVSIEDIIK